MKEVTNHQVDIVIVGGGVAGCTAAIALSQHYTVALIDKLSQPIERIGECLAPAAVRILKQLKLLAGFENLNTQSGQNWNQINYGIQSYWGSERAKVIDHLRNPDGFGWQLNRQAFEVYLRKSAFNRGVICLWGSKLQRAQYKHPHWQVSVQSVDELSLGKNSSISAKFVIDASGRQAHFAKKLGVQRQHEDKLIACWATMDNFEENRMSTISASENGWWYSAPLPCNKRVLAFQTDADLVDRNAIRHSEQFTSLAASNPEMSKILSRQESNITYKGTVAANSTRLNEVVGHQWIALGDAAISFDPLSAQGMFNAMANAMQLTELIVGLNLPQNLDPVNMAQFMALYSAQVDQVWNHYLQNKNRFYREEMRWKWSPFWERRH